MAEHTVTTSETTQPVQQPLPLGYVRGEPIQESPQDLYIPPEALEVFLESFSGPMDLLLYLIRKSKVDILDLPIQEITAQYMEYIDLMQELKLELAAEYLLMAALLAEIKSRMLLPKRTETPEEEDDPRAELLRRLQEYEVFKKSAHEINELPRHERDFFVAHADLDDAVVPVKVLPDLPLQALAMAMADLIKRADNFKHHQIEREALSTRERMSMILERLKGREFVRFERLFSLNEGRSGVVVTFLAVLELTRETLIELVQTELFGPIYVRLCETKAHPKQQSSPIINPHE